ncbi:sugar phosphate isomerase/epimerase family protein [Mesonia aestuariivivens]|uniref:Sugar phosphate isomerase/epimerase n=1 Tax=Mesonia aestuariivivens TaxID=2796128 RepID=A0ABS6VZR7_9FLAO|nr:sugar phosphate isomerase/epimerase [Mesonia aestuariivivens]MBW2961089.1 sugar phosphate isomerase/epimerase [Mesonia aestuariivivens]
MELGICSWTLGIKPIEQLMFTVKELGLDGLHFCEDFRKHESKVVKEAAKRYGLTIFAIDPHDCFPQQTSEATLAGAINFYSGVIDFAVNVNATWVTLQGLTNWTQNCKSEIEKNNFLTEAYKKLDSYAKLKKVKLAVKAVNRYESSMMNTALECLNFLQQLKNHNIGIILDSFHMNIEEFDAVRAIREVNNDLVSYQISDSNRGGIGSGHIDFIQHYQTLKEIGFEGPVIIEIVLPHLAPNSTPRNLKERQQLENEIKRSASVWKEIH